jgi:hypothetical protein
MARRLVLVLVAVAVGGCGFGAGEEQDGGAELRITRDFGHERVAVEREDAVREDQTVMRLLQASHDIETRFGGRFVHAIDGTEGSDGPPRRDWFFWVNGIESSVGAGDFELSAGDVVQWDYRAWEAAMRVPAIVGAFPEPLLSGTGGEKLPVRVECAAPDGDACRETKDRLADAGVTATGSAIGSPASGEVIRVVVAPWVRARTLASIRQLEEGPERSGVFARFEDDGRRLVLLDERGEPARTAPPGTGLVAAISFAEAKSVWIVTGVDDAGVLAAARSLDEAALEDAFAIAVTGSERFKLPVVER